MWLPDYSDDQALPPEGMGRLAGWWDYQFPGGLPNPVRPAAAASPARDLASAPAQGYVVSPDTLPGGAATIPRVEYTVPLDQPCFQQLQEPAGNPLRGPDGSTLAGGAAATNAPLVQLPLAAGGMTAPPPQTAAQAAASRLPPTTPTGAASNPRAVVPDYVSLPAPHGDVPAAAFSSDGRHEIDPINAVVMGQFGSLPPTVQLASQKIPADPQPAAEVIPLPSPVPMNIEPAGVQPPEPIAERPLGLFVRWFEGPVKLGPSPDRGIGYERVAYAPFVIDITSPMTQWAIRIDAANDFRHPDAAEYIFAAPSSNGPPSQRSINYQDYDFIGEMGNSAFSVKADIPVRCIDPATGGSTAGLGDAVVEIKLVPLIGERWKVAGCLDFDIPSGASSRGIGTGHLALEPGLLASLRWTDATYLHAEMKYLIPIPMAPGVAGTVLTWGAGVSHVLYDADAFAVIPTAELVCYSIFNASETVFVPGPVTREINDLTVPTINLGCRIVSDRFRDLGTVEWGVSLGLNLGSTNWYEELVRTELRVMY